MARANRFGLSVIRHFQYHMLQAGRSLAIIFWISSDVAYRLENNQYTRDLTYSC